jgi:hypothetical protein
MLELRARAQEETSFDISSGLAIVRTAAKNNFLFPLM